MVDKVSFHESKIKMIFAVLTFVQFLYAAISMYL